MPYFTVFTPSYNRGYILPKLYQSLKGQSFQDFEWLIVDDGSTDNTERLVAQWNTEVRPFPIRYVKKENGGKPRAINTGVQLAQGTYFFMVDSDDFLYSDALEKMHRWCIEVQDNPKFIGAGAAKGLPDGSYVKGSAPYVNEEGYVDATNLERAKYNLNADMCEAYKTEIFQKYPMAEWPGENFAPEQIALNEIALDGYLLRWHADIIYCCDYLEDGLTKGSRKLEKRNPMGYAMMYNHMLKYPEYGIKRKLFCACQMVAMSFYGGKMSYLTKSNNKAMTILALIPGILLGIRRKKQLSRE